MNILFLTLSSFGSLQQKDIYTDLLREFDKNGHKVCIISPVERRFKVATHIVKESNATILRLKIGNIQKTKFIEKGISTVMVELLFRKAIQKYFSNVKFDLVLYSTPPITFVSAIKFIKERDNAYTYLLLKDIFPQNAVDLGILSKKGLKGILYRHFRKQEQQLYNISDRIGCMSQANVDYVIKHNPYVDPKKVEICPNCIEVIDKSIDEVTRGAVRIKYGIPLDKKVFIYGGNLGKPQGILFIIECLKKVATIKEAFFLIVGDGTEYSKLSYYCDYTNQSNLKLMKRIPKEDFDMLVAACDVGLIFLDHRFTIPNFPSRLLSYMQAKLPVLAITDPNTDVGKIIVDGGFGWWCESSDSNMVVRNIYKIINNDCRQLGINAYEYVCSNYSSIISYKIIMRFLETK